MTTSPKRPWYISTVAFVLCVGSLNATASTTVDDVPPIEHTRVLAPLDLIGEVQWQLLDQGEVVGTWDGVSVAAQEDPRALYATGLPSGGVYLFEAAAPSDDLLLVNGGPPLTMNWNSVVGTYDLIIGTLTLRVGYKPKIQDEAIRDINGELLARVALRPYCVDGEERGVQIWCRDRKVIPKKARNWYQFFNMTITYEGTDADGNPISGKYPYSVPLSGNNGIPVEANGETTYVDSHDETPEYESGAGETNPGDQGTPDFGMTNLYDQPSIAQGTAQAMADTIEWGPPPQGWPGPGPGQAPWPGLEPGSSVDRIIYTLDFTAYLEFCGKIWYRYDWSFRQVVELNSTGPILDGSIEVGGPIPPAGPPAPEPVGTHTATMDPDHQEALDNFTSDPPDYSGGSSN